MDFLLQQIEAFGTLSPEDIQKLGHYFQNKTYKRHTMLLEAGAVAHQLFFVKQGALHQYVHDAQGSERTSHFAFEGEWITDLDSFSRQSPSASNISCLEPSTCLVIRCVDIASCMREMPVVAAFFNKLVEEIARRNIQRIQSLLAQSPEMQFQQLQAENPQWLQRLPQRYIAQYLGIAPESLSRIRKRILENIKP